MFNLNFINKRKLKPFKEKVDSLKKEFYLQNALISNILGSNFWPHGKSMGPEIRYLTSSLSRELTELSNILDKGSYSELNDFLNVLIKKREPLLDNHGREIKDSIHEYSDLFNCLSEKYENGAGEIVGTPLQDSILELIINNGGCQFIEKCQRVNYGEIGPSVRDKFQNNVGDIKKIHNFDFEGKMNNYINLLEELRKHVINTKKHSELNIPFTRTIPSLKNFIPLKKKKYINPDEERSEEVEKNKIELKKIITTQKDWKNLDQLIANYHKDIRSLQDSELLSLAMSPMGGITLVPKTRRKKIIFDELIGYDAEKKALIQNTEKLLKGKEANNAFIYGPPGTGKSSMINALLSKYSKDGLRILEIPKEAGPYLSYVFDDLESIPDYKFIILIDEFKVGKDNELGEALKTVIEGSFDGIPTNSRIYVISNSEKSMKLGFQKEDEAYRSLEDRFGLAVKFPLPNEDGQRKIMQYYINKDNLNMNYDEIRNVFSEYCNKRSITQPNPRNIRDFVKTLS